MNTHRLSFVVAVLSIIIGPAFAQSPDFDTRHMRHADRLIERAIEEGETAGAVLLIGQGDEVAYRKAYGDALVEPERRAMSADTIFDLASLTKPIAIATSIMLLADRGEIDLSDPVAKHLPAFGVNGKRDITIEQLLLHRGGLIPDNPLGDYEEGRDASVANVLDLSLTAEPGEKFMYTDVGYIVLGELVEAVSGHPLDQFTAEEIFQPLGMTNTAFNPPEGWRSRTAGTSPRDGEMLIGEVHDPRAIRMDGVAGHAGLFSTADDLARYCRMILSGGELDGRRLVRRRTIETMTEAHYFPDNTDGRTYGFDVDTAYSSARGNRFASGSTFGHTGFTGTMLWIDPAHDAYVILLTNRLHPDGRGRSVPLRRAVSTIAAEALLGPAEVNGVLTGIDVLERQWFEPLLDQRIGLITNHTGLNRRGRRTLDVLHGAAGVDLVALFSPEHGLYGELDEKVGHAVDEKTDMEVWSLYGETRRPTAEMLENVDTLVFDIQDIGTRFYTYLSTMGLAMEAAAEHGVRMVVLDRPNPLTGRTETVTGPLADEDRLSFIAYGPLPLVHGMTIGELAQLFNEEYEIGYDLAVVEMIGWRRDMWWDDTGLTWIDPSPNMRNPTQAVLYPAVGLLEYSNLSVGRGTDEPFERFGAPWIDPEEGGHRALAAALNEADLPGLRFVPIVFTPESSKHSGEVCGGVHILLTDREIIQPARSGLTMAYHLKRLFGDAWDHEKVLGLLRNAEAHDAWQHINDPADLPAVWADDLEQFRRVRERHLIYR